MKRRGDERGAAAVEFALVVPILLTLVFGIVDFGLMIRANTVLANAAREGARNGSISHSEAVIRQTVEDSLSGIDSDDVDVTVACKTPPPEAACTGSFDSAVESGGKVVVTLEYHYGWVTPVSALVGLGDGVDLEKTVEMRVE
jgi:Flp pilus assembly protein TadG